jgi:sterol desaturase/sphingolipid hydroxylase (fatty acid hydroxylase superfamily)
MTMKLLTNLLLCSALILFITLLVLEALRPYRKFSRHVAKSSFVTNTSAFIFNNVVLSLLSASSLVVTAEHYGNMGVLSDMGSGPIKFIVSFALFDLAVYLWHAASHRFEWLWRFHKIHHSDKSLNVSTGFRFHVFDLTLELIYKCALVVLLGVEANTVLLCEVIRMLFVLFHHTNIEFIGEAWLSQLVITPTLHRMHHSTKRSEHDSNYGIVLSVWDRVFATRKEGVPAQIGLDLIEAENFVQLFCLAFITERKIVRLLRIIPRGRP